RGGASGTGISPAQIMGTSFQPCSRAARAGNAEERSGVRVKIAETMREGTSRFARVNPSQSDATAEKIAFGESSSTWMAPRIANTGSSFSPRSIQWLEGSGALASRGDSSDRVEFGGTLATKVAYLLFDKEGGHASWRRGRLRGGNAPCGEERTRQPIRRIGSR